MNVSAAQANSKSAQSCGCDVGAGHECERHRSWVDPVLPPVRPTTSTIDLKRKEYPLATGCFDYFPDALMEIAHVSLMGNQQHHSGKPLHWDRSKSTDEADAALRHFKDRGTFDTDGVRHTAKFAWRALALLQKEIEGAK